MPPRTSLNQNPLREQLADAAARILEQDGIRDYEHAKRKAGKQLGAAESEWPSNAEIEQALNTRSALFGGSDNAKRLAHLQHTAVNAMELLKPFKPRLVGDVLSGAITPHSAVELHLFAGAPEDVQWFLLDHKIPFDEGDNRIRTVSGVAAGKSRSVQKSKRQPGKAPAKPWQAFPCLRFLADDVPVELTIFNHDRHVTVYCPISQKPMERASLNQLQEMVLPTVTG